MHTLETEKLVLLSGDVCWTFCGTSHLYAWFILSGWWHCTVVNGFGLNNKVNRHPAELVLGWVNYCHMEPAT